jgi:hypothetical protein
MMSGKTGTRSALVVVLALALVVVLALALVVVASVWATNVRAAPATELHVCPGGCTYFDNVIFPGAAVFADAICESEFD